MNRCVWCGTGVPYEGMVCDKCMDVGLVDVKPTRAPVGIKCGRCGVTPVDVEGTVCVKCSTKQRIDHHPEVAEWAFVGGQGDTTDKTKVWGDCAACAYKHISACLAAVTTPGYERTYYPAQWEVLRARAAVLLGEAVVAGYTGNAALAAGCLALAETLPGTPAEERASMREARLPIQLGRFAEAYEKLEGVPSLAALAGGHMAEALRELPELADRADINTLFSETGAFAPQLPEAADWMRNALAWVSKIYEIGVKE